MPHDAHACGVMMSGWQDSLMLKLALSPVSDQSPMGRQSIADKSQIVVEDSTAKVFMK